MLAVESVDSLHHLLFTLVPGGLFPELLERVFPITADAACPGATDFIQKIVDALPLRRIDSIGLVLRFLFTHREIGGTGGQDRGASGQQWHGFG